MELITPSGHLAPVELLEGFLTTADADLLFAEILHATPWSTIDTAAKGQPVAAARLICWVGDGDYTFYGATIRARPWTPTLLRLRKRVTEATGAFYNSVLLNLYRDGHDEVPWHADDESELGDEPTIASLSLGDERRFALRHNASREITGTRLGHGTLAVMHGDAQRAWMHAVPPTDRPIGPRVNLTFRHVLTRAGG